MTRIFQAQSIIYSVICVFTPARFSFAKFIAVIFVSADVENIAASAKTTRSYVL